jgi:YegS/Rv2252/BmrU family lipid kinase
MIRRRRPRRASARGGTVAVIFNPRSGGGAFRRDLPLIVDALEAQGFTVEPSPTTGPGSATTLARAAAAAVDLVCTVGGDGTVNEAINGLAGSDVPLAIVPTGTVNVLAMELGIPLDPPDAVRLVGEGQESWIDVGQAGGRFFGLMAGIGMDAATVAAVNPTLKKALREAAFAIQGVTTYFTHVDPLIRVTSEEREVEGYFAVFGNSSNYGGAFGITPLADMRDGLLDVCVLTDKSFLSTAWYWTAALLNAHIRHPKVQYFRTREARIETVEEGQEVLVQTDGEMAGRLPIDCRIVPHALRVIVP